MLDQIDDPRYLEVGVLPSKYRFYTFKDLLARPFTIYELILVANALSLKNVTYMVRALQVTSNVDVRDLLDQDFCYLLAWQKAYSFPKTPTTASWTCNNQYIEDAKGNIVDSPIHSIRSDAELNALGLKRTICGHKSVYIAHQARMSTTLISDDFELPEGISFPRIRTLIEAEDLKEDPKYTHIADDLRWVAQGDTLVDKLDYVNSLPNLDLLSDIRKFRKKFYFGVREVVPIECLACGKKQTKTREMTPLTVLPFNTENTLLEMQNNLLEAYNLPPDNNMPSKTFLYTHSTLVKKAIERANKAQSNKKTNVGGRSYATGG